MRVSMDASNSRYPQGQHHEVVGRQCLKCAREIAKVIQTSPTASTSSTTPARSCDESLPIRHLAASEILRGHRSDLVPPRLSAGSALCRERISVSTPRSSRLCTARLPISQAKISQTPPPSCSRRSSCCHIDETEAADKVQKAFEHVYIERKTLTRGVHGTAGTKNLPMR